MPLGEFELIRRFFSQAGPQRADVSLGIGDDAALVRVPEGAELVVAADTIVSGVHFPANTSPQDIGYRALAVNLSDMAAMGATPAWATLALTLPAVNEAWLEGFSSGFFGLARVHEVMLIGGDTTSGPLSVTVQIMGYVPSGSALRRSGARVGDLIFVSGQVGNAAAGLALIENRASVADAGFRDQLQASFLRPHPRVALGMALRQVASAAIDISDGLGADLAHVLEASKVGAHLELERLPLSRGLTASFGRQRALELAFGGGDDYELCFTLAPDREHQLASMAAEGGCELTRVGIIEEQPGLRTSSDGFEVKLPSRGFDHFAARGASGNP
ncbi:MAG TPA: thiamine-phosphate kinase [Steroidobacteraceae bacterium]|nr:thiamine-phosphate kinase [Steroidobacteraceae bacterium]